MMDMEELNAWRMIGADMGLEFDELGHPYQIKPAVDLVDPGEVYGGVFDWRPLESDSDCLGLAIHYGLTVMCQPEYVRVTHPRLRHLSMIFWGSDRRATVRRAVFDAAAYLVREKLFELDKQPACKGDQ